MSTTRRTFIKMGAGALLGALHSSQIKAMHHSQSQDRHTVDPTDEQFWTSVRDRFPLSRNRVYFNAGTMGPSPQSVLDAVKEKMDEVDTTGEYSGWEVARTKLARFVNANESEISLTHNTTEGINIVTWGLPLNRSDEVILTTHEHAGNALPWLNRAKLDGIVIKTLNPADAASENLNRLNDLITSSTRVIAIPHITCTAGHVFPAKEIARLGRDKNVWVFLDGAHGAGMMQLDLHDIGVDGYAGCCHKWMCGPKGTGFLYVRKEMLDIVQVKSVGAYSDTGWSVTSNPPMLAGYVPTAHRYDYGTQNAALASGMAAAVDFFDEVGMTNAANRIHTLAERLQRSLLELGDKIEMVTPREAASRAGIVGFRHKGMPFDRLAAYAGGKGFRVRQVPENEVNCLRVSTHIYNNFEEVSRFVELIRGIS